RLAGSFNNWDSFMYEMTETSAGIYQIDIPLPPGTYFYAFFSGTAQIADIKNPDRRYTADGRIASVITVPQHSANR
ncbi:MAG: glycogen-binding domain-containing protein, partial [Spirochaetaceae bacterium]|nr:glycogen-binding domain-containing protein [Spirochaetaceae bacterium]